MEKPLANTLQNGKVRSKHQILAEQHIKHEAYKQCA